MGGLSGPARAESEQRVDGEEEREAHHRSPRLQPPQLRQRHCPDGAGRQRHPQPEHLAHLSALPLLRLPRRLQGVDHRLGGHQRRR